MTTPIPESEKLAELIPPLMQKVKEDGNTAQPVDPSQFGNVSAGFRVKFTNIGITPPPSAMVFASVGKNPALVAWVDNLTRTYHRGEPTPSREARNPVIDAIRTALNKALEGLETTPLRFQGASWTLKTGEPLNDGDRITDSSPTMVAK